MDVDGGALNSQQSDLEQSLLMEFSRMGTTDKDELVNQMQKLFGPNLNYTTASFFLDMNNWNLQEAACCYLDMQPATFPPAVVVPSPFPLPLPPPPPPYAMSLMKAQTGDQRTPLLPGTELNWGWILRNTGPVTWPEGCCIRAVGAPGPASQVEVTALPPNQLGFYCLSLTTPNAPGAHAQLYRLFSPQGEPFGDELWVNIDVGSEEESMQHSMDPSVDQNMC